MNNKNMNEFQERLKELLEDNSLSRLKLANAIGVSSTTLNDYFNKNYYPTIDIAMKMAKFFNCSLDYLLGLSENRINSDRNNNLFFNNLKNVMKGRAITKVFLDLEMSDSNYYRWRDGKFPKTINLIDIAKYFDVSVDYLVGCRKQLLLEKN